MSAEPTGSGAQAHDQDALPAGGEAAPAEDEWTKASAIIRDMEARYAARVASAAPAQPVKRATPVNPFGPTPGPPVNPFAPAAAHLTAKAGGTVPALRALDPNWLTVVHPSRKFAWSPYFPCGCVSALIGEGAVGKSTLLLTILAHVAAGAPYLGHMTSQGRVVYIAAEDDAQEVLTRLQRVIARAGLTPAQHAAITKNLEFMPVSGVSLSLLKSEFGVVYHTPLVNELADMIGTALVVAFDPVSRIHGCEENSNIVSTKLVQAGEVIAAKTGASVVFAHHTGKAAARDELDDAYSARGGSGFADASRSVLRMMAPKPGSSSVEGLELDAEQLAAENIVRLHHAKASYTAKGSDVWLERGPNGELTQIHPVPSTVANDLAMLKSWWFGSWKQKPFARRTIQRAGLVIFGKGGYQRAPDILDQALADGTIIETKGPRRGEWYTFADATIPPRLTEEEITAAVNEIRAKASPKAAVDSIKQAGEEIERRARRLLSGEPR
jgi:hypothetical protein